MTGQAGAHTNRPEFVAIHGYDTKHAMHALRLDCKASSIDHHYLSLRYVGGGHPSGFGLQRAYDTCHVGQDANDDDNKSTDRAPSRNRIEVGDDHQTPSLSIRIRSGAPSRVEPSRLRCTDQNSWQTSTPHVASRRIRLRRDCIPSPSLPGAAGLSRHDLEAWVEGKESRLIAVLCHRQDQVKLERRQRPLGIGNPGFALTVDWCEFQPRAPVARIALRHVSQELVDLVVSQSGYTSASGKDEVAQRDGLTLAEAGRRVR